MSKDRFTLSLKLLDEFYEWCTDKQLNPTLQRFEKWLKEHAQTH